MIESNEGRYTLSADRLAQLVGDTGATRVAVRVTQLIASDTAHDEGTVWAVLHTGDGVVLKLE
jgi:hypothetical protein